MRPFVQRSVAKHGIKMPVLKRHLFSISLAVFDPIGEAPYSVAFFLARAIISSLVSRHFSRVPFVFLSHSSPRYPGPGPISSPSPEEIPSFSYKLVSIQPLSRILCIMTSYICVLNSPVMPESVSVTRSLVMRSLTSPQEFPCKFSSLGTIATLLLPHKRQYPFLVSSFREVLIEGFYRTGFYQRFAFFRMVCLVYIQ